MPTTGMAGFSGGGDFNGDGNADLVCVQPESQIDPQAGDGLTVWEGNWNGGFSALSNSYKLGLGSDNPFAGTSGDFKGDGMLDSPCAEHHSITTEKTDAQPGSGVRCHQEGPILLE
jgi:hypothetical protein